MSEEPRSEDLSAEGEGETVGEAKWAAMKELEPRFPGITADSVNFDVVEEPEGGGTARVRAEVDEDAWRDAAEVIPEEPGERVRAVVGRIVHALGLRATVDIEESDEELRATVNGDELGLLIGKHGTTIDAVQHLAFRGHGLGPRLLGHRLLPDRFFFLRGDCGGALTGPPLASLAAAARPLPSPSAAGGASEGGDGGGLPRAGLPPSPPSPPRSIGSGFGYSFLTASCCPIVHTFVVIQ